MILCAAIKFNFCGKDIVSCGCRHGDVYKQLFDLDIPKSSLNGCVEGFITHKNEFLTRKEAFEHAKSCGQLCEKIIYDRENGGCGGLNLISEDLW